ncbi:MAG: DUF1549 domain-containing protein [Gemmataceae bacterium]
MHASLLLLLFAPAANDVPADGEKMTAATALAHQIDALTEKHWRNFDIKPAATCGDTEFLRRLTLDLAGRIPTYEEARAFAADASPDKRQRAIARLMNSPEFTLQLGRVLDEIIQGNYAGDAAFRDYLRAALAEGKSWDQLFREIMLGPWDNETKPAEQFLLKRIKSLDDLTNDTARVFFGVDVSCAKCHDHPLVADWKQDHFYGMASFFNPTVEGSKANGGKQVLEKSVAPVQFVTTGGERKTAQIMFLSGQLVTVPEAKDKPKDKATASAVIREQLVQAALQDRHFFSRSIVNRWWAYLLGRGLIDPVDQMHSANPPTIPGVLELLADDFADNGYQLDRIVAAIVSSKVYQLSTSHADDPGPKFWAKGQLRPLAPEQFALSFVLATSDGHFDQNQTPEARAKSYRALEGQAGRLTGPKLLDPRSDRFESSAREALFLSNHNDVQQLLLPAGNNLTARLVKIEDSRQLVETAVWTILSRPPEAEEHDFLAQWLDSRATDRGKACRDLLWALLTSAEFRFNH